MSTGFSSTTNKEAEAAINRQRTLMALLALLLGCMVENGVVEIEIWWVQEGKGKAVKRLTSKGTGLRQGTQPLRELDEDSTKEGALAFGSQFDVGGFIDSFIALDALNKFGKPHYKCTSSQFVTIIILTWKNSSSLPCCWLHCWQTLVQLAQ